MITNCFGIDVSKKTLDIAFYDGKVIEKNLHRKVSNDTDGFDSMLQWMTSVPSVSDLNSILICFESTGVYSRALQHYLEQKGVTYSVVGGDVIHNFTVPQSECGLRYIKTDKADAIKIAIYCYVYREQLRPSRLPSATLLQLRRLVSERRCYIDTKAGFCTRQSEAYPEESDATLSRQSRQINYLEDSIQEVNKEIFKLISSDDALLKSYQLLTSIPGIGQVVASDTIAYTENFSKVTDPRKYCSFIGLMSYEQSSGKHQGKPKRRIVRHPAKTDLSAICPINISLNPDIRSIYERMSSQGKPKGVIFNRIKCIIVKRMFAVIRRGTPFEYRVDSPTL